MIRIRPRLTKWIHARVTEIEKLEIEQAAKEAEMKASDYIRSILWEASIKRKLKKSLDGVYVAEHVGGE